jgi:hypothetical protein
MSALEQTLKKGQKTAQHALEESSLNRSVLTAQPKHFPISVQKLIMQYLPKSSDRSWPPSVQKQAQAQISRKPRRNSKNRLEFEKTEFQ